MENNKIEIIVNISGIELKGELMEIINVLHIFYKVPSTTIYQLMGEIGIFAIDAQGISFTRPYYVDEHKQLFSASVQKIQSEKRRKKPNEL